MLRHAQVLVVLASLAALGAAKPPKPGPPGRPGRPARPARPVSDSGRSLLDRSTLAEFGSPLQLDDPDEETRGQKPGLVPWQAQAHIALHNGYRQLELPLLECRCAMPPDATPALSLRPLFRLPLL